MEEYRPIFVCGVHFVALYAIGYISASLYPANMLEYIVLAAASLWMLYGVYLLQKERRRMSSLFFAGIALMPWAFYGELYYINANKEGIPEEVFAQNLEHAIFIYQSFKFVFLACATAAALKGLIQSIREFGSTR